MEKLNKPFEPITTLAIIYLALVILSIALYALIQIYFDDKSTASNLLSWTATIFATIALLYTLNSWRDQKGSEVLSKKYQSVILDFYKYEEESIKSILMFKQILINKKSINNFFDQHFIVLNYCNLIEKELRLISIYNNDLKYILENFNDLFEEYQEIIYTVGFDENSISIDDIYTIEFDEDTSEIPNKISEYISKIYKFKILIEEDSIKYIFYKK